MFLAPLQSYTNNISGFSLSRYHYKEKGVRDSIPTVWYEFESKELAYIQQVIIDSFIVAFGCDKLEQVLLKAEQDSNCVELTVESIRNLPYISFYPEDVSLACFEINSTLFFLDDRTIRSHDFFKDAASSKNIFIFPSKIKYDCLAKEIQGELYDVLFVFNFEVCPDQTPELKSHSILVDSGDIGYFYRPNIWEKIRMFFYKIFKRNR